MRPGRVYNGADRQPVQFVIIGWRIGLVTSAIGLALAVLTFQLITVSIPAGIIVGVLSLVAFFYIVRVVHKSDPYHTLSEMTVYRLALFGTRKRYVSNH